MSHGATVLVVDDDEDTVETMRDILTDEGHVVMCAHNGKEALALARATPPDLVLLDLNMPEMDGRAFMQALRADVRLARVSVVVVSGAPDAPAFAAETVEKPLRLDTLLGLIDRAASAAH